MTDMTQFTELPAFIRQKDGYKVTVKMSLCICVVLSWDELKFRQNLLDSDYNSYDYRPNWTPLGPIPIINGQYASFHRARAFVVYFAELTVDFSMKA